MQTAPIRINNSNKRNRRASEGFLRNMSFVSIYSHFFFYIKTYTFDGLHNQKNSVSQYD